MNVIIKKAKHRQWWSGASWTAHKKDAIIYPKDYAKVIIAKRWPNGIKERVQYRKEYWQPRVVDKAIMLEVD